MGRHRRPDEHAGFRLLYVCTGNICRSPFAEILTRHLLIGRLGGRAAAEFDLSSAGVRAVVGSSMFPDARRQLAPWNLDGAAERFVARQLRPDMVRNSDLVLGASVRHRSVVVEEVPASLAVAFTVCEFARLIRGVDPDALPRPPLERAHALVGLARSRRGRVHPNGDDSVADPMGHPESAHREAARQIRDAVTQIVDSIAPRGWGSGQLPVVGGAGPVVSGRPGPT